MLISDSEVHHTNFKSVMPYRELFHNRLCGVQNVLVTIYRVSREECARLRENFLTLKYTDLTKNTYIRSWMVTEIMARENCGLLAVPRTVPGSRDVLPVHCVCPSFSLQLAQAHSRCDCTCEVLGNLRTIATLVRFNWMALCHSDVN
jgi:hypothetical protein